MSSLPASPVDPPPVTASLPAPPRRKSPPGVSRDHVVTVPAECAVVALAGVEDVRSGPAVELVVARPCRQGVLSALAEQLVVAVLRAGLIAGCRGAEDVAAA